MWVPAQVGRPQSLLKLHLYKRKPVQLQLHPPPPWVVMKQFMRLLQGSSSCLSGVFLLIVNMSSYWSKYDWSQVDQKPGLLLCSARQWPGPAAGGELVRAVPSLLHPVEPASAPASSLHLLQLPVPRPPASTAHCSEPAGGPHGYLQGAGHRSGRICLSKGHHSF